MRSGQRDPLRQAIREARQPGQLTEAAVPLRRHPRFTPGRQAAGVQAGRLRQAATLPTEAPAATDPPDPTGHLQVTTLPAHPEVQAATRRAEAQAHIHPAAQAVAVDSPAVTPAADHPEAQVVPTQEAVPGAAEEEGNFKIVFR